MKHSKNTTLTQTGARLYYTLQRKYFVPVQFFPVYYFTHGFLTISKTLTRSNKKGYTACWGLNKKSRAKLYFIANKLHIDFIALMGEGKLLGCWIDIGVVSAETKFCNVPSRMVWNCDHNLLSKTLQCFHLSSEAMLFPLQCFI